MTALLILAAAIAAAYVTSYAVTPLIASVLRLIDRRVHKPAFQMKLISPQVLIYEIPIRGVQPTVHTPTFALAATILVIAMTVPPSNQTVVADVVQCNA